MRNAQHNICTQEVLAKNQGCHLWMSCGPSVYSRATVGHVMACIKQKWVDTVLEGPGRYLELEQGQQWEPANKSQEQSVCKDQDTRCARNASDGLALRCRMTKEVPASPGRQDLEAGRGGAQQPAPWWRVKRGA